MEGQGTPQPILPDVVKSKGDIEGWLVLTLPADAAQSPIWLAYMDRTIQGEALPSGQPLPPPESQTDPRAYAEILLREPGPPVGVTPVWTPAPGQEPPLIEAPAPHAEADALFTETATCSTPEAGYEIQYPATWYTDADCRHFSALPLEGTDPSADAIQIERQKGTFDPNGALWDIGDMTIVPPGMGGFIGGGGYVTYFEWEAFSGQAPVPAGERMLAYEIVIDGDAPAPANAAAWWLATTTSVNAATDEEYELNKAVLHRIVRSMHLTYSVGD